MGGGKASDEASPVRALAYAACGFVCADVGTSTDAVARVRKFSAGAAGMGTGTGKLYNRGHGRWVGSRSVSKEAGAPAQPEIPLRG